MKIKYIILFQIFILTYLFDKILYLFLINFNIKTHFYFLFLLIINNY